VFDFAKDYLGLLKAGGSSPAASFRPRGRFGPEPRRFAGASLGPGRGLELVSSVNGIPKGSRLAVSTNLLASMISLCMRATASQFAARLAPGRRTPAGAGARHFSANGSAFGRRWQDSGGVWPA